MTTTDAQPRIEVVDLAEKLSLFDDHWRPRIVGAVNDSYVKLAKVRGEFLWHSHAQEDELFLVLAGKLVIKLRDRDLEIGAGQMVVIPRGVEHMPVAEEEVHLLLLEPKATRHTGEVASERTVEVEDQPWI